MEPLRQANFLLDITRSRGIMRRYFVVNGFDGALTMLGLIMGFIISDAADSGVIISACLGAAVALGVSGVSSAYVSEAAERKHALSKLEVAMITDLSDSAHGQAARWVPMFIALVNGSAPLMISLFIIAPLWLANKGLPLPLSPLVASIAICLTIIFLLGVFLGRIAGISWIRSGMQTILIAGITIGLIYLLGGS